MSALSRTASPRTAARVSLTLAIWVVIGTTLAMRPAYAGGDEQRTRAQADGAPTAAVTPRPQEEAAPLAGAVGMGWG